MNIWNFIKKDWAIFFRDRGAMLWLFILPLVFIAIFAGLARHVPGRLRAVKKSRRPAPPSRWSTWTPRRLLAGDLIEPTGRGAGFPGRAL